MSRRSPLLRAEGSQGEAAATITAQEEARAAEAARAALPPHLEPNEKIYVKVAQKHFIFAAGLSVTEQEISNLESIHRNVLQLFVEMVDNYDPFDTSFDMYFRIGNPRESVIPHVKSLIKKTSNGLEFEGKTIWSAFKNMKSEFKTVWVPNMITRSGDGNSFEEAFERVRKAVWCHRKNLSIEKNNKRKGVQEPGVTLDDCPEATMSNTPAEMGAFRAYYDHPLVALQSNRGTTTATASSAVASAEFDNNDEDISTSDDVSPASTRGGNGSTNIRAVGLTSGTGVKNVIQSRREQRKKVKLSNLSKAAEETKKRKAEMDLKKQELEVSRSQAGAAKVHADSKALKMKLKTLKFLKRHGYENSKGFSDLLQSTISQSMNLATVSNSTPAEVIELDANENGTSFNDILSSAADEDSTHSNDL